VDKVEQETGQRSKSLSSTGGQETILLGEGVHFLQKPFSPNSLAVKIREVLKQT
jgi:hypothetical protein